MSFWFGHGLRRGIQTTRYPRRTETAPGVSPGRPVNTDFDTADQAQLAEAVCPTGAIIAQGKAAIVDQGKCVDCQRCRLGISPPMRWEDGYEWTRLPAPSVMRKFVGV